MEPSGIYTAIKDMIENGLLEMFLSDFPGTLVSLEQKGLLTEAERKTLLTLANDRKDLHETHFWPPKPGPYFPISGKTD